MAMVQIAPATVRLQNGGLFESPGFGRHPERVIDSWELIMVRSGCLVMHEDAQEFRVPAGGVLILRQGLRHGGLEDYQADLSFYWLHFDFEAGSALRELPQCSQLARPARAELLCRLILQDQAEGGIRRPATDLLLQTVLLETLESASTVPHSAPDALAERAARYLQQHYQAPLSTVDVAANCHVNPDYLGRVYRQRYGCGIIAALHRLRLDAAARELATGRGAIAEIGHGVGFQDVAHFRRLFRRHFGCSPSAYRAEHCRLHVNSR